VTGDRGGADLCRFYSRTLKRTLKIRKNAPSPDRTSALYGVLGWGGKSLSGWPTIQEQARK